MAVLTLVRIGLMSDCYPPRVGGIETHVHALAHRLAGAGHEVEVFTATHQGPRVWVSEAEASGSAPSEFGGSLNGGAGSGGRGSVLVHRMPLPIPGAPPINPRAGAHVRERLTAGGFDVVHAHLGVISPFAAQQLGEAIEAGLPAAATFHCVLGRNVPLLRALGQVRRWADAGVALSAVSALVVEELEAVAPGADVRVLHNGIDAWRWLPPAGYEREDDGVIRIATATRLVRRKRPWALVKVLGQIADRLSGGVRMEARIIGDGPLRRPLVAWQARAGLDWLRVPGRLDHEELRKVLWDTDFYLNVSHHESFGIAALEARSAGVVVAGLEHSGIGEFVAHGVNGILAPTDNALAAEVAGLIADRPRLDRMRRHNLTQPPEQAWDRVVQATEAEYARAGT